MFMPKVKEGYNLVFVPRKKEEYAFAQICESMQKLLQKADLLP